LEPSNFSINNKTFYKKILYQTELKVL
jgi:hypothetical protein